MDTIKVSVIVPIYNAASNGRLARLLGCLKDQTLKEIEFLLIFDRPTDNSYDIAVEIVGKDSRFVFFENSINIHIGLTRNIGIDMARGEFIAYADDDDMMEPNMYNNLYKIAKERNVDVVVSPAIFDNQGKVSIELFDYDAPDLRQYFINHLVGELSEKEKKEDPYPYLWANGNMWNKIFRRSLIVENKIRFVNTQFCSYEDILFQLEFFCCTKKIAYDNIPYYTHIYYADKSNTSRQVEYTSDMNRCNFLSKLVELCYCYPEQISQKRAEKKVIDTLIEFVSKDKKISRMKQLRNCFNRHSLYQFITWYPTFLHEEKWEIKRFYLFYIFLIKLYLKVSYGKNSCGLC